MSVTQTLPIQAAIPWLDTFQRSRDVDGGIMALGIGDGEVLSALALRVRPYERLVVIDNSWQDLMSLRARPKIELILIDEDPLTIIDTEAMDLEHGHYRIVAINATQGVPPLLAGASLLIGEGGLVMLTPWINEEEEGKGIHDSYWEYVHTHPEPLIRCGVVGNSLLLANSRTWQRDYEAVIESWRSHE